MTTTTDFLDLPKFQPRSYLPEDADLKDKRTIQALYKSLLEEPIASALDLEGWLMKRSELDAAVSQESAVIYIRMTCQTDDQARVEAYKHFLENIEPIIKEFDDALNKKFVAAHRKFPLDKKRYHVYIREVQAELEIFAHENVPLQTKEQLLSQEYQSLCGAMTVNFEGKEYTLPQMGKFLVEPERPLREAAWRASSARRLQDKVQLDELFDRMLEIRHRIALNAGFGNYRDYKFKALGRFDYTPEDCKKYHDTIETVVMPLWGRILESKRKVMKLDTLRPWDLQVDVQGRPPLKPFEAADQLIKGCSNIFKGMDKELGEQFAMMADQGLLDLESRKGKAPGGYQHGLHEARLPFIFMNAVGLDSDMRTLLHEAGHAFHMLACREDTLFDYRHGPMEFNEVASMAMEILPGEKIVEFYTREETNRSILDLFEDTVYILVWVATIDCFQHWIYENPTHTQQERSEVWLKIKERFDGGFVDWEGLEEEHAYLWHRQLHIFEVPFYYIEYGIAQLGALQLWLNTKNDRARALKDYKIALSLGGSRALPELYEAAGIKFDFSRSTIKPLMDAIVQELEEKNPHF